MLNRQRENSHCRASLRLSLPPDARSLNTAVSVAAGLELSSIMLDYFAATQDEDFLRYTLIPVRKVIQKGTRVLISLWDSLMFGRVPNNAAPFFGYPPEH